MWVVPDLQLSYDRSDAPSDKLHSGRYAAATYCPRSHFNIAIGGPRPLHRAPPIARERTVVVGRPE
jgi:hypothetical protein